VVQHEEPNGAAVQRALEQVRSWPVPTAAAAVVSRTGVVASAGPLGRPFAWASLTKLLTALAAMDTVGRGLLGLDDPAGPPGSTVRHLLAHASGLSLDGDLVLSRPGRRRTYSNAGIEAVADIVATRCAKPFAAILADEILEPLGLSCTVLEGSPARGAVGPLRDLITLAQELLFPTVIDPDLLEQATSTAFPGLSGVVPGFGRQASCDWGLGFEVKGSKDPHWTGKDNSPRTFGHFGRAGGFLWVDPDAALACVALTDREFGPWAARAWPQLSDSVLAAAGRGRAGRSHG
jgi:CubicO group peptidase (beta-lactamase class C family)